MVMLRKYQEHSPGGMRHLCMLILLLSAIINRIYMLILLLNTNINSLYLYILHHSLTLYCLPNLPGNHLHSSLQFSSFIARNVSPNSATSSPMLRTKNNYMAEVDLVRTSLPVQQERQRMDTPPAYREPVDSLAIYHDTLR